MLDDFAALNLWNGACLGLLQGMHGLFSFWQANIKEIIPYDTG